MEFRTLARRVGDGEAAGRAPTAAAARAGRPSSRPRRSRRRRPIDTTAYACVRDVETLDAWIARAREAGVVGFDTETDALSLGHAGLCGVSLAVAPGEACYIPLGHCAADAAAWLEARRPTVDADPAARRPSRG